MRLEGIHHVTAITGDVLRNVDFYSNVLGLRLVGKSVNQDDPTVYHVFYSDEHGRPGSDITFFEYRDAAHGRAGSGMVHRVLWRVASEASLAFWLPRIYAFASTRLPTRPDAEAVTRATLEIAMREGVLEAGERAAPRMLCIVKAQLALRRSRGERG